MASVSFFSQPLAFVASPSDRARFGASSKIRFIRVHNNHKPAELTVSRAAASSSSSSSAALVFRDLDADDFRHPVDKENTMMLRAIPGLKQVGKALLGIEHLQFTFEL